MSDPAESVTCSSCRSRVPASPRPATWSVATERGLRTWTCPSCVRGQLHAIEARYLPVYS